MSPIRILFVSYAMHGSPSILGLLKRCLRLIDRLPGDLCEPHLVHLGWVPDDPFTRRVMLATPHVILHGPDHAGLLSFALAKARPHVVVVCEPTLITGIASAVQEVGADLVCIENLFHDEVPAYHRRLHPDVDGWLFLGLPARIPFGHLGDRAFLAPPLLPDPIRVDPARPLDVLIQGYDLDVARFGLALVGRLPRPVRAAIVLGADSERRLGRELAGHRAIEAIRFLDDPGYQRLLGAARLMIGKDGFQQIVEALAVGTRVICRASQGGVGPLLPAHFSPYVGFSGEASPDWPALVRRACDSLAAPPGMPWHRALGEISDAAGFAVRGLGELLRDRPYRMRGAQPQL
jgi:hypothetical protein